MNTLPKDIKNIVIKYIKDIHSYQQERKNRIKLHRELRSRYNYECNEFNFSRIYFDDKQYIYIYEPCRDGIKRLYINYIYVIGCLNYYFTYDAITREFIEEWHECRYCACITDDIKCCDE